jgi:hypothetical protein
LKAYQVKLAQHAQNSIAFGKPARDARGDESSPAALPTARRRSETSEELRTRVPPVHAAASAEAGVAQSVVVNMPMRSTPPCRSQCIAPALAGQQARYRHQIQAAIDKNGLRM